MRLDLCLNACLAAIIAAMSCVCGSSVTIAQTADSAAVSDQTAAPSVAKSPTQITKQTLKPTSATINRPKDWFYAESSHQGLGMTWTISAEDTSGGKSYDTGVRIQALRGLGKMSKMPLTDFVEAQIQGMSKRLGVKVLSRSDKPDVGPCKHIVLDTEEEKNRVLYDFYWGTGDLDCFVIVIQGAPKDQWEASREALMKISRFDLSKVMLHANKKRPTVPSKPIVSKPVISVKDDLFLPLTNLGYQSVFMKRAKSGHLILPVKVNGSDELRFMCDTGANVTVVTTAVAESLKLEGKATNSTVSGVGGTGEKAVKAEISSFQVGSHASNLSEVLILEVEQLNGQIAKYGDEPVDGILGSNWMRMHQAVIDVARRRLFFKAAPSKK